MRSKLLSVLAVYAGLILLLLSCSSPLGPVSASQVTSGQDEMANEVLHLVEELSDVNVSAYELSSVVVVNETHPVSHITTGVSIDLRRLDASGELGILARFIDGRFEGYNLYFYHDGDLVLLKDRPRPGDPKEVAMQVLDRCLATGLFNASFYEVVSLLLSQVSPDKNQTVLDEEHDMALEVEVRTKWSECVFRWYWAKGELKAKGKGLAIYIDMDMMVVKIFSFAWPFYKIGSTDINVSEEEAVQMALEEAEEVINETGAKVKDIDTELVMGSRVDYFTLYPIWLIWIWFDGFYEYGCEKNVIGYHVAIWADTGEIKTKETVALIGGGSGGEGSGQEHEPVAEPNVPPEVPPNQGAPKAQEPLDMFLAIALPPTAMAMTVLVILKKGHSRRGS